MASSGGCGSGGGTRRGARLTGRPAASEARHRTSGGQRRAASGVRPGPTRTCFSPLRCSAGGAPLRLQNSERLRGNSKSPNPGRIDSVISNDKSSNDWKAHGIAPVRGAFAPVRSGEAEMIVRAVTMQVPGLVRAGPAALYCGMSSVPARAATPCPAGEAAGND